CSGRKAVRGRNAARAAVRGEPRIYGERERFIPQGGENAASGRMRNSLLSHVTLLVSLLSPLVDSFSEAYRGASWAEFLRSSARVGFSRVQSTARAAIL